MPLPCRTAILVALGLSWFGLIDASQSCGQTVWTGYTFSFTHPASSSIADEITPNVYLTRGLSNGLYNSSYEVSYLNDYSPEYTLWATEFNNPGAEISATNYEELQFIDWRNAYGGNSQLMDNIVGANAVVYLSLDEIYLDLRFMAWGGPGSGGMFAYERAEPPTTGTSGDYNGNNVVDAADYTIWRDTLGQMVDNPGDGADGDLSGTIDAPDYQFWKDHFGQTVAGAGAGASVVPEPVTSTLLFGGLMLLAAGRQSRSARLS